MIVKNTIKKTPVITLAFILLSTTLISIQAIKPTTLIPMQQEPLVQPLQLQLAIPSSMGEGREFVVGVYTSQGPIADVIVFWLNGTYITDSTGRVTLTAPMVDHDTSFEIRAIKQGYQDAVGQILIINQLPQLILIVPSEVHENDNFVTYVHDEYGNPIEGVRVGFRSGDYYFGGGFTGPDGTAVLTAPEVNHTTIYEIGALKSGYRSGFAQITVFDTDSGFGWIYGIVCDANTSIPINNVTVCARRNGENMSHCVFTNDLGQYAIQVLTGEYTVSAQKEGYVASVVLGVFVPANTAVEVNFLLSRLQPPIPTIVYVDDDFNQNTSGWGYDHFNTIQAGINAVAVGGSVFVYSGTYVETIIINKQMILDGQWKETVFLNGNYVDNVITVTASNVLIDDMTIQNSGSYKAGILVDHATTVSIYGTKIHDCTFGIALEFASNCIIELNTIYNCSQMGILLEYSTNNMIARNSVSNSGFTGIHLVHSTTNNTVFHNNFINNDQSAFSSGYNLWDNGYPSGGNYWSDYTGIDANGDGIGDTPYIIPGSGNNQDNYPLMIPYI